MFGIDATLDQNKPQGITNRGRGKQGQTREKEMVFGPEFTNLRPNSKAYKGPYILAVCFWLVSDTELEKRRKRVLTVSVSHIGRTKNGEFEEDVDDRRSDS